MQRADDRVVFALWWKARLARVLLEAHSCVPRRNKRVFGARPTVDERTTRSACAERSHAFVGRDAELVGQQRLTVLFLVAVLGIKKTGVRLLIAASLRLAASPLRPGQ